MTSSPSEVKLELNGKEHIMFHYQQGKYQYKVDETNPVFQQVISLGKCNNGQTSIPFSFVLPSNLPNSFDCIVDKWNFCKTFYSLKASAGDQNCEHPMTIVSSIVDNAAKRQEVSLQNTMPLVCYGCCGKGNVNIAGKFDKTQYSNKETIKMDAQIQNNSTKECKIYGQCFLNLSFTPIKTKATKTLKLLVGQFVSDVVISPNSQSSNTSLSFILSTGDNQPTCDNGSLFKAHYTQVITAKADLCCCDRCNKYPILESTIYVAPKAQNYTPIAFGVSNWAPQISQPVVFTVNSMIDQKGGQGQVQINQPVNPKQPAKSIVQNKF